MNKFNMSDFLLEKGFIDQLCEDSKLTVEAYNQKVVDLLHRYLRT